MKKLVLLVSVLASTSVWAQAIDFSGVYDNGAGSALVVVQKGSSAITLRPDISSHPGTQSTVGFGVGVVSGNTITVENQIGVDLICSYWVRYTFSEDGQKVSGEYLSSATTPAAAAMGLNCPSPTRPIPQRAKLW